VAACIAGIHRDICPRTALTDGGQLLSAAAVALAARQEQLMLQCCQLVVAAAALGGVASIREVLAAGCRAVSRRRLPGIFNPINV
jgi:hypothetical protein